MRKKRVILFCLIGPALVLIALIPFKPPPREPSIAGHPLNYWVGMLGSGPGPVFSFWEMEAPDLRHEMATNAIDHIGVAGLPFLMKWIQYEPAPWRLTLFYRLARTPFPPARKLSSWIIDQKTPHLSAGACAAFNVLGTRAIPAFDELCRLMNNTNRPATASRAAMALGCFGTNALPQLLAVARNPNHPAHNAAGIAIVVIQDPRNTLPAFPNAP